MPDGRGLHRASLEKYFTEHGCSDISQIHSDKIASSPPSSLEFLHYDVKKESFESVKFTFNDPRALGAFLYYFGNRFAGYRMLSGPHFAEWKPNPERISEAA